MTRFKSCGCTLTIYYYFMALLALLFLCFLGSNVTYEWTWENYNLRKRRKLTERNAFRVRKVKRPALRLHFYCRGWQLFFSVWNDGGREKKGTLARKKRRGRDGREMEKEGEKKRPLAIKHGVSPAPRIMPRNADNWLNRPGRPETKGLPTGAAGGTATRDHRLAIPRV